MNVLDWTSDPIMHAWAARQIGLTTVSRLREIEQIIKVIRETSLLPLRWNPYCLWCATYGASEASSMGPRFTWDPIICRPLPRHRNP